MAEAGITNFGVLLNELNEGAVIDELSQDLSDVLDQLRERAIQTSGKVKGKIVLKLDIQVTSAGLITIDPDVETKVPKPLRKQDSFHLTRGGGLSRKNERQQELPLREVRAVEVETREVGANRPVKEA